MDGKLNLPLITKAEKEREFNVCQDISRVSFLIILRHSLPFVKSSLKCSVIVCVCICVLVFLVLTMIPKNKLRR